MTLLYHSDYYKIWFQISMTHPMIAQKNYYMLSDREQEKICILYLKEDERVEIKNTSLLRFYLEQITPMT